MNRKVVACEIDSKINGSGFSMKRAHLGHLALAFSILLTLGKPAQASSLIADFADLFERCRLSIESASELDTAGLIPIPVPEPAKGRWGADFTQNGWQFPDSTLYVVQTAWTDEVGQTRRVCHIRLQEGRPVLTAVEQGLLIRHFLIRQTQLFGERTHKWDGELSPIPPAISLGFKMTAPNPKGCTVTNGLALSQDGTFFSASSGEQAIRPCELQ